jgi:hypothetical protein
VHNPTFLHTCTPRRSVQVLRNPHVILFDLLGKTSAVDVDKLSLIETKLNEDEGQALETVYGHQCIPNCHGYVLIYMMSGPVDAGDHDIVICSVSEYKQRTRAKSEVLSTHTLQNMGWM